LNTLVTTLVIHLYGYTVVTRIFLSVLLGWFWLVPGGSVLAQEEQYSFRHINVHHEVTSILKDRGGFIWVGTSSGLHRFDGYTVKTFRHDPRDTASLLNNLVKQLFETPDRHIGVRTIEGLMLYDPETERFGKNLDAFHTRYGTSAELKNIIRDNNGAFWFVEPGKVIKYTPADKKRITFENSTGDPASISADSIADVTTDRNGAAWIVHRNGSIEKIAVVNGQPRVVQRIDALSVVNTGRRYTYRIFADGQGDLWVCVPNYSRGVYYVQPGSGKLSHFTTHTQTPRLNSNLVSGFTEVKDGIIWVATDQGGINVIDKKTFHVTHILHREEDSRTLAESSVKTMYRDNEGIVWAGTFKRGVSYYHEDIVRFDLYKNHLRDKNSLPFGDVNRFAEDDRGNVWIGTNGGGLLYFDRSRKSFTQYKHNPADPASISGDVIVSLCRDAEGILWVGTYNHGLNRFDGKRFTRFTYNAQDTTSIPSQNVWEVFEDSKKRLWIGTLENGVALLNRETGKFQRLKVGGNNAIQSAFIFSIAEDRQGNIWFGTVYGIDVLSSDGKVFTHYTASSDPKSLSSNNIWDIKEDSKGRIWIATIDGLNRFDPATKTFQAYRNLGLQDNSVLTIQEDNAGNIWLGTLNGLCQLTVAGNGDIARIKHYTEADGLQGLQFNENAAYKTKRGELFFGGPSGFNILKPEALQINRKPPAIVFTDFQLYQKPVIIGEEVDGVVALEQSVTTADNIVLPPGRNFFSIDFSALDYFGPEKNRYAYNLEGLNTEWVTLDEGAHRVTFNSLNPGTYTLHVKAMNSAGIWSDREAALRISIEPPFWKTKTAFVVYFVFLLAILFAGRKLVQQREKMKFAIEHERQEALRMRELDLMKIKFFTNVSHEFRTPLSLIISPAEDLMKRSADPGNHRQFELIYRNAKRLLHLVNQLLDFRKLEVHEIKFNPTEGNIIAFIKEVVLMFSDLSERKSITLEFQSSITRLETVFDRDKLERILFNLLSNAFKFTPGGGHIVVRTAVTTEDEKSVLQIDVQDTGIGIPHDKLGKIFERFFQNDLPSGIVNQGSGIGLSITQEFVKMHGGRVEVKSAPTQGSCFTVLLPVVTVPHQQESEVPVQAIEHLPEPAEAESESPVQPVAYKNKTLLLVEDNDDFRFYLKDNLKATYNVHEARNGAEGWTQVLAIHPDLVISDIMMPEMNGIELCRKIKGDERVSHIPVVLLTARSDEGQRIEGFDTGAEEYIAKPFSFEILEARIRNLIHQREKSQKAFRKTLDIKASELQVTSLDTRFIENAVKCVEKNIAAPDFSVEALGDELGISRAYLYKKMVALTGKSPLEFIRTIRLQHAAQLLEKSQLTVSEVAYKVGFNTPKYFTKYFKEEFNMLPSAYAAAHRKSPELPPSYRPDFK